MRDGCEAPAAVKLIEIDSRGRQAQWTGIDQRGRAIAGATLAGIRATLRNPAGMTSLLVQGKPS